jgi:hypothetical protein
MRKFKAKYNRNSGKEWTSEDIRKLRSLVKENTPIRVICLKMGRTEDAIRSIASEESISLRPTNLSLNNRAKIKLTYNIQRRFNSKKWVIRMMNAQRSLICFDTKKEAIEFATEFVSCQCFDLMKIQPIFYVHRTDGTVERKITSKTKRK